LNSTDQVHRYLQYVVFTTFDSMDSFVKGLWWINIKEKLEKSYLKLLKD
jgi:hypothetical protein